MFGKEVGDGVVAGLGVFGDKDHRNPGAEYPKAPSRTRAAVREGGAETGDGSGKIPTTQTNAVRSSPGPRSREKHGAAPQPSEPNRDKNTHTGVRRPSACGGQAGGVSAFLSGLSVWSCFHQRIKTTAGKMMRLLV